LVGFSIVNNSSPEQLKNSYYWTFKIDNQEFKIKNS
jgi:hypothetical protein